MLLNKVFNIAKNPNYDRYQRGIASMVYRLVNKKSVFLTNKSTSGGAVKSKSMSNKELAQKLHKPIIRKFEKQKGQSSFIDNIWGVDLADMQLINKFNKGIHFLLCVIEIFNIEIFPFKNKNELQLQILFQKWV